MGKYFFTSYVTKPINMLTIGKVATDIVKSFAISNTPTYYEDIKGAPLDTRTEVDAFTQYVIQQIKE